ncbi:UNVERIFIED_CONTAM: protein DROOPING LEAF [Sesamum radiatum]|uniref:Protein DROOPING LEAF n=1 Tax=Sesamum radiatum TaxID=300843 RepID=A0AAW2JQG4_SESRA
MEEQQQVQSSEHFCYIRCNFCNTVLAVGIPCKKLLDTVTVKCGHCSNLSFLSTCTARPPIQPQCFNIDHHTSTLFHHHHHHHHRHQGLCSEFMINAAYSAHHPSSSSSSSSSTISTQPSSPKAPFVVKPPEKKHRLPSAYNRFMKYENLINSTSNIEEIQRIKAADPEIPHREAFSAAAKNWARYIPNTPQGSASTSGSNNA